MGRKRIDVKFNGIPLHANVAGREIRVTRDVKKQQNTTNYRLIDSTKPRYVFQSTDLNLVKKHYDKYVANLSYKIDIPAVEVTPTDKDEIKIKWLQIFDKDEDILNCLFDFYDEQHFVNPEEGEDPIPINVYDYEDKVAISAPLLNGLHIFSVKKTDVLVDALLAQFPVKINLAALTKV